MAADLGVALRRGRALGASRAWRRLRHRTTRSSHPVQVWRPACQVPPRATTQPPNPATAVRVVPGRNLPWSATGGQDRWPRSGRDSRWRRWRGPVKQRAATSVRRVVRLAGRRARGAGAPASRSSAAQAGSCATCVADRSEKPGSRIAFADRRPASKRDGLHHADQPPPGCTPTCRCTSPPARKATARDDDCWTAPPAEAGYRNHGSSELS